MANLESIFKKSYTNSKVSTILNSIGTGTPLSTSLLKFKSKEEKASLSEGKHSKKFDSTKKNLEKIAPYTTD